jgi:hypothetical protein
VSKTRYQWEVIAGNVGTIYNGRSKRDALNMFRTYCRKSRISEGKVAGEDVTVFKDGEIFREYRGHYTEEEYKSCKNKVRILR